MTDTKNQSKGNSRSNSPYKKGGSSSGNSSRAQSRQETGKKEFFKEELKRLKEGLQREASRIQKPERKSYTPYTFTTLKPYYDAEVTTQIIEKPSTEPRGYTNRQTAIGLCDPWIDHRMDHDFNREDALSPQSEQGSKKENNKKKGTNKKAKEGKR